MISTETFTLILIKPTRYDNDGYPVIWTKPIVGSNTLAVMYGIANDCRGRKILGEHVDIRIIVIDETTQRINTRQLVLDIHQSGGKALVGLVGVQSNQYPRAMDIARPFCESEVPVCIGGFHVSGSYSMLKNTPPEISEAIDMGISLFLGEAEEQRLDKVIQDAHQGSRGQIYDFSQDAPGLEKQPLPVLPKDVIQRTYNATYNGTLDLGRGCPFVCSFCCIINVQGHKSRFRTADDLEKIIRYNHSINVRELFITDDNFARNKNWEIYMDKLIELREQENIKVVLTIQVDTLCHKIPGFIEKCARGGVEFVFIGMENINPENLIAAGKRQNNITEYRGMMLEWKRHHIYTLAGYIIGFPKDTHASLERDIDIIMNELPVDALAISYLTPLPGSEDHKNMLERGEWMDPDLNNYDLAHRVTRHPLMNDSEWEDAFQSAWLKFHSFKHMKTVLRRNAALGSRRKYKTALRLFGWRMATHVYHTYSFDFGYFRLKYRKDRRPGMPLENPLVFYSRYLVQSLSNIVQGFYTYHYLRWCAYRIFNAPDHLEYTDAAITPVSEKDFENMNIFKTTAGGQDAVVKFHKKERLKARVADKIQRNNHTTS